MAVGFEVGFFWFQIGSGDFLHCFFSTVAMNLENGNWGSRFPFLMNKLYQGNLASENVSDALKEVSIIQKEFMAIHPSKVVWDIEDMEKVPPWGDNYSEDITSLADYYVTSDGEDFFMILKHALEKSRELGLPIQIVSL